MIALCSWPTATRSKPLHRQVNPPALVTPTLPSTTQQRTDGLRVEIHHVHPDGLVLEPTGREGQHSAELFGLPLEALADLVHLEFGIVQRAVENLL